MVESIPEMLTRVRGYSVDGLSVMVYPFGLGSMLPKTDFTARLGLSAEGRPEALILTLEQDDDTIECLLDGFSATASLALRYKVRLEEFVNCLHSVRPFAPSGRTSSEIGIVRSVFDYLGHLLDREFKEFRGVGQAAAIVPEANPKEKYNFSIAGSAGTFEKSYFSDGKVAGIKFSISHPHEDYYEFANGICAAIGDVASFCLKCGIPLEEITEIFRGRKFRPHGKVDGCDNFYVTSVMDYVAKVLKDRALLSSTRT